MDTLLAQALPFLLDLLILAPPLLIALTFHEVAHGFMAYRLGDPTAKQLGRLTLNPLKHLDPLGTLLFFVIKFGWAKPIPVNPRYFQYPKQAMLLVALAGPMTNVLLAIVSALILKIFFSPMEMTAQPESIVEIVVMVIQLMFTASVWINLVLCVLNLLPIPPLDGSKILVGLLPDSLGASYLKFERYGFILILVLFFSGGLSKVILPIIDFANRLLIS